MCGSTFSLLLACSELTLVASIVLPEAPLDGRVGDAAQAAGATLLFRVGAPDAGVYLAAARQPPADARAHAWASALRAQLRAEQTLVLGTLDRATRHAAERVSDCSMEIKRSSSSNSNQLSIFQIFF